MLNIQQFSIRAAVLVSATLVATSIAGSLIYNFFIGRSLSTSPSTKSLATACSPSDDQQSDVYFVSCGGTF